MGSPIDVLRPTTIPAVAKPPYLLIQADARSVPLPDESVHICVTSPPYYRQWVYGDDEREIGHDTLWEYVDVIADCMDEAKRILVDDGFLWLNLGDKSTGSGGAGGDFNKGGERSSRRRYGKTTKADTGLDNGQLCGAPWLVAQELQRRGWLLRADIIWNRMQRRREDPNHVRRPIPQHEYLFLFAKSKKSNKRYNPDHGFELGTIWEIEVSNKKSEGKAPPFPDELVRRCVVASTQPREIVFDPFIGHGTTIRVSRNLGRRAVGLDLYPQLAR